MKLQIKDAGAWRNVVAFDPARQREVMDAAAHLMEVVNNPDVSMRVEEDGEALAHCKAPTWAWRKFLIGTSSGVDNG